jgi:hypothetical protein
VKPRGTEPIVKAPSIGSGRKVRATALPTKPKRRQQNQLFEPVATMALEELIGSVEIEPTAELLGTIRRLMRALITIPDDVSSPRPPKRERKRKLLANRSVETLRSEAPENDDAFFELVRRDKRYAFTQLARAKVMRWTLHREVERTLGLQVVDTSNPNEKLIAFTQALVASPSGRKHRVNAKLMRSYYAKATRTVLDIMAEAERPSVDYSDIAIRFEVHREVAVAAAEGQVKKAIWLHIAELVLGPPNEHADGSVADRSEWARKMFYQMRRRQ